MNRRRYHLALASYWILFIILPLAVLFEWLGGSASSLPAYLLALVILVMIGEHGFRRWKRIWRVAEE